MRKRGRGDATQRQPTMSDVAAKVGVSRQLVGLVFRGGDGVHPDTESRIRSVAKEIGFRPNLAAQTLRQETSRHLGVVFHTGESSMDELIPSLYRHADDAGYKLVLSAVSNLRSEDSAIEEVMGHRCEGIILISSHLSKRRLQLLAREIPMVSLGRRLAGVRCGSVSSWGERGVAYAVQHLIAMGHERITCVHAVDMNDGEFRLQGYLSAMQAADLQPDVIEIEGNFGESGGALAAEIMLKRGVLPTAVVCNNDQSAFGLAFVLQRAGVRVPADISLIGYDDTLAQLPFLLLTTVHQDSDELAAAALSDLGARIRGEKRNSETILTSAKLVVRESTAAPVNLPDAPLGSTSN